MQAFAWFSDLLVEHAEIFWSLFAVDMDQVLTEQPPDTWDSFPLFQIMNDYLRTDGKLKVFLSTHSYSCHIILSLVQAVRSKICEEKNYTKWT
jgi:Domain of Unknown Function (DUF1041).